MANMNDTIEQAARAHQNQLTKPRGALGRLEDIACWFAVQQGQVIPDRLQPHIAVFAADHGVVDEGVSAYPSVVTGEMVKNFAAGGAAINVLAKACDAKLSVWDVGTVVDLSAIAGIGHVKVRKGTGNIACENAMTCEECEQALQVGRDAAQAAVIAGANLLIAGDMGIGNTTASAALICALTQALAQDVVGYGTGVDDDVRAHKIHVVNMALARLATAQSGQDKSLRAKDILCLVGGLEIAAMAGFYLEAYEQQVPIVVDGFIATAAALVAKGMDAEVVDWMLASHVSQEKGHALALQALGLEPLLDLGMRLGEGSGAALVIPLLQSALTLHREMATFATAGVTDKGA